MMNELRLTKSENRKINIVLMIVFSVLLFVAVGGIFNRIAYGERKTAKYIPNIILTPISLFFVVRNILVLKGKIKPAKIPWMLFRDIAVLAGFVFIDYLWISLFFNELSFYPDDKGVIVTMVLEVFMSIIFLVGTYLWFKMLKTRWSLFGLISVFGKSAEEKKAVFIKNLMSVENLYYITDISVNPKLPYVDKNGLISLYDSTDLSDMNQWWGQ